MLSFKRIQSSQRTASVWGSDTYACTDHATDTVDGSRNSCHFDRSSRMDPLLGNTPYLNLCLVVPYRRPPSRSRRWDVRSCRSMPSHMASRPATSPGPHCWVRAYVPIMCAVCIINRYDVASRMTPSIDRSDWSPHRHSAVTSLPDFTAKWLFELPGISLMAHSIDMSNFYCIMLWNLTPLIDYGLLLI
jgi:hypothetical protein